MHTTNPSQTFTQTILLQQPYSPNIPGHILKFVKKGKPHIDRGIICFPQQTYGNAQQAPQQFKSRHSKIPKNGYLYRHQNKSQFKYYSQQRYFSIDGSKDEEGSKTIFVEDPQNYLKFHRKKGRLGEWMDKNGWMNKTTKMIGFQRTDRARDMSNRDRAKKIAELKPKIIYDNIKARRPDTSGEYFKTLGEFTTKKMKIRTSRNDEAQRFSISVQPRNTKSSHRPATTLELESIENRMLRTVQNWSPSKTTKSRFQSFNRTFVTNNSNRLNNFENTIDGQLNERQYSWRQNCEETLEDWYRTTCHSKWVYNKKLESEETEEETK